MNAVAITNTFVHMGLFACTAKPTRGAELRSGLSRSVPGTDRCVRDTARARSQLWRTSL